VLLRVLPSAKLAKPAKPKIRHLPGHCSWYTGLETKQIRAACCVDNPLLTGEAELKLAQIMTSQEIRLETQKKMTKPHYVIVSDDSDLCLIGAPAILVSTNFPLISLNPHFQAFAWPVPIQLMCPS